MLMRYKKDKFLIKPPNPSWKGTLVFLSGILEREKSLQLVEAISKNYFANQYNYSQRDNPYLGDLYFAQDCLKENPELLQRRPELAERINHELDEFYQDLRIRSSLRIDY